MLVGGRTERLNSRALTRSTSGHPGNRIRCRPRENDEMLHDPLFWLLVLPGLLLETYAQWRITASVAKYSQVSTKDGITGAEVARRLLHFLVAYKT